MRRLASHAGLQTLSTRNAPRTMLRRMTDPALVPVETSHAHHLVTTVIALQAALHHALTQRDSADALGLRLALDPALAHLPEAAALATAQVASTPEVGVAARRRRWWPR